MADTKTTALPAIPALDPADVLPIVDATDMTSKKVSVAQLDTRYTLIMGQFPTQIESGRLHWPAGVTGMNTSGASNANDIRFWPYIISDNCILSRLGMYCWTAEAGSLARLGIYNANEALGPTSLVADLGTVSGDSTGSKFLTTSQALTPGVYLFAVATSNHSSVRWGQQTSAINNAGVYGDSLLANDRPGTCRTLVTPTDYSAGLPSTSPATYVANGFTVPRIILAAEFT